MPTLLSLFAHPFVALFWLVVGAVAAYFVLKNNKKFLNASLASLAQDALDKASGVVKKP